MGQRRAWAARSAAMAALAGLLAVGWGVGPAGADEAVTVNNCSAVVEQPRAPGTNLFTWTTVTCTQPSYISVLTSIRNNWLIPGGFRGKVVASNVTSATGYTTSLYTGVRCNRSGRSAWFDATTTVSVTWNGHREVKRATTQVVLLPCVNGGT